MWVVSNLISYFHTCKVFNFFFFDRSKIVVFGFFKNNEHIERKYGNIYNEFTLSILLIITFRKASFVRDFGKENRDEKMNANRIENLLFFLFILFEGDDSFNHLYSENTAHTLMLFRNAHIFLCYFPIIALLLYATA